MTRTVTTLFRNALRFSTPSIGDVAREAGFSPITWDVYANRRAPSLNATLALADVLERRAARLSDYAVKLREAAADDPRGADS